MGYHCLKMRIELYVFVLFICIAGSAGLTHTYILCSWVSTGDIVMDCGLYKWGPVLGKDRNFYRFYNMNNAVNKFSRLLNVSVHIYVTPQLFHSRLATLEWFWHINFDVNFVVQ